jgi:plastocyanin
MKKLLVLLIACLALTITACGGDDDDDGGGGSATTTEQPAPADDGGGGGDGGGEAASVDIPDISFEPAELTVKAGTTVTWTNSDDLTHTVTKDGVAPGPEFDSGDLEPGDEFEQTFDEPGEINYICTIHAAQQRGTIIVE